MTRTQETVQPANYVKRELKREYEDDIKKGRFPNVRLCDFVVTDTFEGCNITRRVFMADISGLDWPENRGCHVTCSLYYQTHKALTIMFATKKDAFEFVESEGKIDRRIIEKKHGSQGWILKLKGNG